MEQIQNKGVYDRRSLFVWASFCTLAGLIFLAYALTSLALGRGVFVMPLDDVYIHFQYAKQMALGQPYIYNPGLPPTSGATSFLYPYMLAVGYLLGFQGLNLGLWAMLLGMVALACSTWLVYRLVKVLDAPEWLAILAGIIFAISGPVSWHFMSGMETGWAVLFTLGTLYALTPQHPLPQGEGEQKRVRYAIIFATLLALIRPEGGILAVLAMVALFLQIRTPSPDPLPVHGEGRNTVNRMRWRVLPLLIPILAIGIQPLINLLLTGSAVASGNAAKSVFGMIPFYWDAVIGRILSNWAQMWSEFLSGSSTREGLYIAPLMLVLAIIGLLALLRNRNWRVVGLMVIGWLAFGTLAISTLDTAFWHFKRYQMPFVALLFPLAGWGIAGILRWGLRTRYIVSLRYAGYTVAIAGIVIAGLTWIQFLHHYALNVDYVYQQPLQMARWLEANTPPDAVIAVHDVGMMRYMGGRTTLDMVGLTTPGAADYWRNGPGSVAEFLIQQRPDYIASYGYGHGFGLGMLADTDIYGQPLASFPVDLDANYNVALAANFQGIYKPDWNIVERSRFQTSNWVGGIYLYGNFNYDMKRSDNLNVADIESERLHHYKWNSKEPLIGFPTEIYQTTYPDRCLNVALGGNACLYLDSCRRIDREENFDLSVTPKTDAIVISRIISTNPGSLDIYVEDQHIATRVIPAIPGRWIDIPIYIPGEVLNSNEIHVRIVPNLNQGYYFPCSHAVYQGKYSPPRLTTQPATSFQNGSIQADFQPLTFVSFPNRELIVSPIWYTDGSAQGDYKVFVHVLDQNDNIVAQFDSYPSDGTLPPGNWLPGAVNDVFTVDLQNAPPGKYRVAMGLYNPYTFERLQPSGGDDQNRFFIGDVEIK